MAYSTFVEACPIQGHTHLRFAADDAGCRRVGTPGTSFGTQSWICDVCGNVVPPREMTQHIEDAGIPGVLRVRYGHQRCFE